MATPNNQSPRNSTEAALNSPQSRRAPRVAPRNQIVRSGESESIVSSAAPSSPSSSAVFNEQATLSSDSSPSKVAASSSPSPEDSAVELQHDRSDNGSNAAKKPVWNKPSNGAAEVAPVMGADSWPPLSESTRASPKSLSSESLKALSDGSASISQGSGFASSSSQKQIMTNNANTSLTANHVTPTRQKFMRRGGGSSSGSVPANGAFLQSPLPSPGSGVEMPSHNAGKSGSVLPDSSPREHTHKESGQRGGFGSQSHNGNDHTQQRNSFRRGNGGPHPRGDGSYHHNYGNRRDQDRGNHDWNHHRSFNGRDAHMQPQRVVPRNYVRPQPHSSAQLIPPPPIPVRPFGNHMVYPDVPPMFYFSPPPDSLRGLPIVSAIPPHAMYYPLPDPQLHTKIAYQIDYYFSDENLIKDTFLRQKMDDQGWVPINLIAGFKKVAQLSDSIPLILDSVRTSTVVEVQGDKLRRRNDWMRWIMPLQVPTVSSPQSLGRSSYDTLTTNMQSVSLEERNSKQGQAEAFLSRSSSGDLSSQSQPSSSEGIGQGTSQAGSERSSSTSSTK